MSRVKQTIMSVHMQICMQKLLKSMLRIRKFTTQQFVESKPDHRVHAGMCVVFSTYTYMHGINGHACVYKQ